MFLFYKHNTFYLFLFFIITSTQAKAQYWNQIGADIDDGNDWSRPAISISDDGRFLARLISDKPVVFVNDAGQWKDIKVSGLPKSSNKSFYSLSLSGDGKVLAIGNMFDDQYGENYGIVKVYTNNNSLWEQKGSDIYYTTRDLMLGKNIALSSDGNTLAVSVGSTYGGIYIYQFNGSEWSNEGRLGSTHADYRMNGSLSLSRSGSMLAFTAQTNFANGNQSARAIVFEKTTNGWSKKGSEILVDSIGDKTLQIALNSDGTRFVIGNPNHAQGKGIAQLYEFYNQDWNLKMSFFSPDNHETNYLDDNFGSSVGITGDGKTVVIAAQWWDCSGIWLNQGKVFTFEEVITSGLTYWKHFDVGSPKGVVGNSYGGTSYVYNLFGEYPGDRLGSGISLSEDGKHLALSAQPQVGRKGYARVYQNEEKPRKELFFQWVGNKNDFVRAYSYSSISDDGSTVAALLPWDDYTEDDERTILVLKDSNGVVWKGSYYKTDANRIDKLVMSDSGNTLITYETIVTEVNKKKISYYRISASGALTLENGFSLPYVDGKKNIYGLDISRDAKHFAFGDGNAFKIYEYSNGTWNQLGSDIPIGSNGNVAISLNADGSNIAIGTKDNDNSLVQVEVYRYTTSDWQRIGQVFSVNYDTYMPMTVSLSANGKTLAMGEKHQAAIYRLSNNVWTLLGEKIDSDFDRGNGLLFIDAVHLLKDGETVLIGSNNGSDYFRNNGNLCLWKFVNNKWIQLLELASLHHLDVQNISFASDKDYLMVGSNLYQNWRGYEVGYIQGYKLNLEVDYKQTSSTDKELKPQTNIPIKLYPNPAGDNANLILPPDCIGSSYAIFDFTGSLLSKGLVQSTNIPVDLSGLKKGMYFISIGEQTKYYFKFIKI